MREQSNEQFLILIDTSPLRRAGLTAVLRDWSAQEGLTIDAAADPVAAASGDANVFRAALVILSIGGLSLLDDGPMNILRTLKGMAGDAPLVIIADVCHTPEIVAAFRFGASAYLPTLMDPAIIVPALTIVRKGGQVFPPSALFGMPDFEEPSPREGSRASDVALSARVPSTDKSAPGTDAAPPVRKAPRSDMNGPTFNEARPNDARHDEALEAPLTGRQTEVLEYLGRGQSNKHIARALGMTEATVKVHVRQVIRKLGVSNRTQAAVLAGNVRPGTRARKETGGMFDNPVRNLVEIERFQRKTIRAAAESDGILADDARDTETGETRPPSPRNAIPIRTSEFPVLRPIASGQKPELHRRAEEPISA
jgi:DNA-binding NarL/FixJ family response regulator